ncbi:MAG: hypothetical protein IJ566_06135 [Cardiobacteriaceae bacterium]|nr:hypothetical protein [Cardiobacteriaceae bacterium]
MENFSTLSLPKGSSFIKKELISLQIATENIEVLTGKVFNEIENLFFTVIIFLADDLIKFGKEILLNLAVNTNIPDENSEIIFREENKTGMFYVYCNFIPATVIEK